MTSSALASSQQRQERSIATFRRQRRNQELASAVSQSSGRRRFCYLSLWTPSSGWPDWITTILRLIPGDGLPQRNFAHRSKEWRRLCGGGLSLIRLAATLRHLETSILFRRLSQKFAQWSSPICWLARQTQNRSFKPSWALNSPFNSLNVASGRPVILANTIRNKLRRDGLNSSSPAAAASF